MHLIKKRLPHRLSVVRDEHLEHLSRRPDARELFEQLETCACELVGRVTNQSPTSRPGTSLSTWCSRSNGERGASLAGLTTKTTPHDLAQAYNALSGTDRARLEETDPDTHAKMRHAWNNDEHLRAPIPEGSACESLSNAQRACLDNDPQRFAKLCSDWVRRGQPEALTKVNELRARD